MELFTIGSDYLVEPVYQDIREGESSADALLRLLREQGYVAYYTGTPSSGFYLAYIGDGDKTNKRYNGAVNSQSVYGSPPRPGNWTSPPLSLPFTSFAGKNHELFQRPGL